MHTAILVIYLVSILFCVWIGAVRNTQVHNFRGKLIHAIAEEGLVDIQNKSDWSWRWKEYETVSYSEMVIKFWKPLKSFYKDYGFTGNRI